MAGTMNLDVESHVHNTYGTFFNAQQNCLVCYSMYMYHVISAHNAFTWCVLVIFIPFRVILFMKSTYFKWLCIYHHEGTHINSGFKAIHNYCIMHWSTFFINNSGQKTNWDIFPYRTGRPAKQWIAPGRGFM